MNALEKLLHLNDTDKQEQGVQFTPKEIAQQPQAWRDTLNTIDNQADELRQFISRALVEQSEASVHLVGAGTSHFVGESVRHKLAAAWQVAVIPTASTEVVLAPLTTLTPTAKLMISFARSGQSPEGNAALKMASSVNPGLFQLAVTCNRNGELARLAANMGKDGYALILPDLTNDKGLAMTSSYSSMVVAAQALAHIESLKGYQPVLHQLADSGEYILSNYADLAAQLADTGFNRAVYIGNRDLYGVALESHLKMQEMTAGRVLCKAESTLGLRHGPMAAIDEKTLVLIFLSADPYVRQYEMDLLKEMSQRQLGQLRIAIADKATPELAGLVDEVVELAPQAPALPDLVKAPAAIIFPQLLALFRSLAAGFAPDAPSPAGVINRVVQGVTIYPFSTQEG